MAKQAGNIIRIIEAGSNVIVSSVSGKGRDLLIRIAEAAVANKVHVTFMNCENWSTETLIAVAEVGRKYVTLKSKDERNSYGCSRFWGKGSHTGVVRLGL